MLSIVLPFIVFPLLWLTSSKTVMRVRRTAMVLPSGDAHVEQFTMTPAGSAAESGDDFVDYSNGKITVIIGWIIWTIIVVANVYAIVTLAMGET